MTAPRPQRRIRSRRRSVTARFGLVLAVLGALIALFTAAISMSQLGTVARDDAQARVTDKAETAVELLRAEQVALSGYVSGLAGQLPPAVTGAALAPAISESSRLIGTDDLVGLAWPGGVLLFRHGSSVDASSAPWDGVVSAAGHDIVVDAGPPPFMLASASLTGAPGGAVFVARPITSTTVAEIDRTVDPTSVADLAVVSGGRYLLDGRVGGEPVEAGQPVDGRLAGVVGGSNRTGVVQLARATAVASRLLLGSLHIVVSMAVPPPPSVLSGGAAPLIVAATAVLLLALVLAFVVVERSLGRPLRRLDRAVSALAREDFDEPVPVGGDDEIGRLARSFERMRGQLRATIGVAEARAEIAAELSAPQPLGAALDSICGRLCETTQAQRSLVVIASSAVVEAYATGRGLSRAPDPADVVRGEGPVAVAMRAEAAGAVLACALEGSGDRRLGMRSICAAPVRIGQRTLGVVAASDPPDGFTGPDVDLVVSTAEQVALALERAHVLALAQRQAITDELTGLYNYRFLVDYVDQQIALAERLGAPLSLLMLDIDRFKLLNDEFGHHVGDQALREFATTISRTIRRADLAARYGGEEFCIVMANTGRHEAATVAEKVRAAVAEIALTVEHRSEPIRFTVSIGGVAFPDDTGSAGDLLRLADQALYRAKREGRDRVRFPDDGGGTAGGTAQPRRRPGRSSRA